MALLAAPPGGTEKERAGEFSAGFVQKDSAIEPVNSNHFLPQQLLTVWLLCNRTIRAIGGWLQPSQTSLDSRVVVGRRLWHLR